MIETPNKGISDDTCLPISPSYSVHHLPITTTPLETCPYRLRKLDTQPRPCKPPIHLLNMSLYLDGVLVPRVSFHPSPQTRVSAEFCRLVGHTSVTTFLFTTTVDNYPFPSIALPCQVVPITDFHVILGLDWATYVREFLVSTGYRLGDTFQPWLFFSLPTHPLGTLSTPSTPRTPLNILSVTSSSHSSPKQHPPETRAPFQQPGVTNGALLFLLYSSRSSYTIRPSPSPLRPTPIL
ncbi:hypothetical protein C8R47DRAFT_1171113 [Mycena vitilis]|nr:hypothetical protein C8R47DRAFT_1171113 [Mycena vitilis]